MDLINFLGSRVKIIVQNDYYYIGEVVDATENDITIIDLKNNRVCLQKDYIISIQEARGVKYGN